MKVRLPAVSFSKQQASGDSLSATPTPLRNRSLSSHRSNRNPFLNLPIVGRLTLGFLIAALIAAIAAGATGVERVQSLNKEASFYQDLLQTNTDLNTGAIFLAGNLSEAQTLLRFQAEPTNADALSALRTLIQFEGHLAVSVSEAASIEEQNQLDTTFVATVVACLAIALVGWFISNTIVTRLRQLRRVTQAVEQGELLSRVRVIGQDEIADVSLSVNTMLENTRGCVSAGAGCR